MCMKRYNKNVIRLCLVSCLLIATSCQKSMSASSETGELDTTLVAPHSVATATAEDDFENKFLIPDSVATPEQLKEKERILGFILNEKVVQYRNNKIEMIADSSLFYKNNIDIRYMSVFKKEFEETNRCCQELTEGDYYPIPKDSLRQSLEEAFRKAQKEHAKEIIE